MSIKQPAAALNQSHFLIKVWLGNGRLFTSWSDHESWWRYISGYFKVLTLLCVRQHNWTDTYDAAPTPSSVATVQRPATTPWTMRQPTPRAPCTTRRSMLAERNLIEDLSLDQTYNAGFELCLDWGRRVILRTEVNEHWSMKYRQFTDY